MPSIAWEMTYSVDTDASPAFAWNYWTNIANWDDPPAEFELDGPFASGSRGTTRLPGQEPLNWLIREVSPPQAATITLELQGADLSFQWRFEGLPDGRTRITQRVALHGENAGAYISQVESTLPSTLPDGMNKIAAAIANSEASRKGSEAKGSPGHYTR